jgi:hypothetical protein
MIKRTATTKRIPRIQFPRLLSWVAAASVSVELRTPIQILEEVAATQ